MSIIRCSAFALLLVASACSSDSSGGGTPPPINFTNNPCSRSDTVQLAATATALIDCSAGGTTVTLAGGGANYLVVPQFATEAVADQDVGYTLATGTVTAAERTAVAARSLARAGTDARPASVPGLLQQQFESLLMARAQSRGASVQPVRRSAALFTPPALGSSRVFSVESGTTNLSFKSVNAQLAYIGSNIYLYIDSLAPANGFTPAQLAAFGQLFDQTMYPIDVNAFGAPSDIDGNGHVIVLMTPVVNALSPAALCPTQGYIAGFFESADLDGSFGANSNNGEIFYSIVPDPNSVFSCSHTVSDVGLGVPATFLHELQHLINYSQHVIIHHGLPESSWLDEGMSIAAEELGSLYYEQKFPPPTGRSTPGQIFPDSSQGFTESFLYDSYEYALLPDTASVTLHNDSQNGFSWRGGAWLMVRYLADQYGSGVYQQLELGPADGLAAITAVASQPFPTVFANMGLALYADSFPGLPRTTAPAANRFVTRNMRQIWARLFTTEGNGTDIPLAMPLTLSQITTSTATWDLHPGTMTFWRLNTAASDGPVTLRFATPSGTAFGSALHPQMAIMRLPDGQ